MKQKEALDLTERLLTALNALVPFTALHAEVVQLRAEGHGKDELLSTLEKCVMQLRAANREKDEDTVLEVMDYLAGWCSPQMEIS